ncbi:hypothetical protein HDV05_005779, partial [Chytridiales sp. JEL 0842]
MPTLENIQERIERHTSPTPHPAAPSTVAAPPASTSNPATSSVSTSAATRTAPPTQAECSTTAGPAETPKVESSSSSKPVKAATVTPKPTQNEKPPSATAPILPKKSAQVVKKVEAVPAAPKPKPIYDSTTLAIRLPEGAIVRQKFEASDTLKQVRSFVEKQASLHAFDLVQPYPAKTFTAVEESLTLK